MQNEKATEDTFRGGWLNTGDLAVQQANGRIQIRDRSKDVIIRWGRPGQEGEGVVSCKARFRQAAADGVCLLSMVVYWPGVCWQWR